ncbi:hypothetical protein EJ08DRAFT_651611 [Tothia fuscella]|uniref:Mso1 N-terminal domain-containing protein n=1 Tax=Tothia fuscella TaxID=1048955 RepID=A0A9P4NMD7_9PEZI|nr:hypothetical protein EJ08DRAFT_651611 [Tothia fuscella]
MTSSFLSGILTTTTSKYNNLRRQLISSEADGDTEDDSHIARVLRAYYTEKARTFPEWLPPDPKAPPPTQFVSSNAGGYGQTQQGGYGQPQQTAANATGGGGRWGRGGLSDLWDGGNKNAESGGGPESLRQSRPNFRNSNSNESGVSAVSATSRFSQQQSSSQSLYPPESQQQQGRPLPSQRAGSYQSQFSSRFGVGESSQQQRQQSPPTSSGGGTTAQERLKQRLWGGAGRAGSPTNSTASLGRAPSPALSSSSGRNPYEAPPQDGGRFGGGASRVSNVQAGGNPYASGGGGGSGSSRPVVSANSPWAGSDDYGGGGGGGYDRPAGGLPSGPRAGRQGVGLPSGPKPKR